MNFQQSMYTAFIISMALMSAAAFITYRNDLTINMTAFWLILTAIPFFIVGMPAFFIRHSGLWNQDQTANRKENQQ